MSNKITGLFIPLAAVTLVALLTSQAHAIPAFSRAHKIECTTCHTIYPELNEYGEVFLKNSYVYSKAKKSTKAAPAATPAPVAAAPAGDAPAVKGQGDAAKLSKLKAGAMGGGTSEPAAAAPSAAPAAAAAAPAEGQIEEGLALAGIPELLPISFTGSINYSAGDRKSMMPGYNEIDFSARSFTLLAGGNFRDMIGFYTNYTLYSEGGAGPTSIINTSATPSNSGSDLNEMFVQWRNALGTPVNVKIGRMQPKLGLWKTSNKLTVTNKYLPYSYLVGPYSEFSIDQPQDAIELNAILGKRFFAAGGIVNHKGQNQKDGYGHISYKFGGADYLGNEPNVDLDKEEQVLDFLVVTVGGYGYFGQNGTYNNSQARNTFQRYGIDTEVQYKIFRLRMLGGFGQDGNIYDNLPANVIPGVTAAPWTSVISRTGTIEGELTLLTNLIAAGRFEYLEQSGPQKNFNNPILRRYVGTVSYAPIENFKLTAEFKYDLGTNVIDNSSSPSKVSSQLIGRIGTLSAMFSF